MQLVPPHVPPTSSFVFSPSIVSSRADYITQYYTEFDFDHSLKINEIYDLIATKNIISLSTDGGAILHQGSLGFLMAKQDGTHLFMWYGQLVGIDPHSYKSEICVLLAGSQ